MINNFNKVVVAICQCNHNVKFLFGYKDAKAIIFSSMDYITKTFGDIFQLTRMIKKESCRSEHDLQKMTTPKLPAIQ